MDVLHITPHLGGGVGKAVAALVGLAPQDPSQALFHHRVLCLEPPERDQFCQQITAQGWTVHIPVGWDELRGEIAAADLVVVHLWAHPCCAFLLAQPDWPDCRLIIWSHMSGLGTTRFPAGITALADRFLVSAPASYAALGDQANAPTVGLMSSGLIEGLPPVPRRPAFSRKADSLPVAGYVGTLNPAKIHPDYATLIASIPLRGFQVTLVGDDQPAAALRAQAASLGRPDLLRMVGYHPDVMPWLSTFHLFLYLLNPDHYGTAENALLEAMAMGVVPVVWDNPAERDIVKEGETGFVVRTGAELTEVILTLCNNPDRWDRLSQNAAAWAREACSPQHLRQTFAAECDRVMKCPKTPRPQGVEVLGRTPAAWFLAFQADRSPFGDGGIIHRQEHGPNPAMLEPTKGSVFHFQRNFPTDLTLQSWAEGLNAWQREQHQ